MTIQPISGELEPDAQDQVARLKQQLARERKIRMESEAIAEQGLRESFLANQRFELLCAVADASNRSNDPIETLRFALTKISETYEWAFANVLLAHGTHDDQRLEGCGLCYAVEPEKMGRIADLSSTIVAWPCASVPGRTLIEKRTSWEKTGEHIGTSERDLAIASLNLRSSYSVPVLRDEKVVAVMEFFDRNDLRPDKRLLDTLNQIGVQIGRVFKRKANEQKLHESAFQDRTTGLPNRAALEISIGEAIDGAPNSDNPEVSLVYFDLNGLRRINDAFGFQAGDQVLSDIASRLRKMTDFYTSEPFEGAPDHVAAARVGGDEFAVLISGASHRQIASDIAADIHKLCGLAHNIQGAEIFCCVSVGVVHGDAGRNKAQDVLRDASLATHQAKSKGVGHTVILGDVITSDAREAISLEADLRSALEQRQFELFYQPIVTIPDGNVVGFEALARWRRGQDFLSPEKFIPGLCNAGLSNLFDDWVIHEACDKAARLLVQAPRGQGFYISVNVSPVQFLRPGFVAYIEEVLAATHLPPNMLVIEVTEQPAIANYGLARQVSGALRAKGIRISLDDFGTGHASFEQLHAMDFDAIKLDRSFVIDQGSKINRSIAAAVLNIARASDIAVIAEGIECKEQERQLAEQGYVLGQGFLYGQAVPGTEVLSMLARQQSA